MSMIPLVTGGTWWIISEVDPRWNDSGHADVGGLVMPPECEKRIEELKQEFGELPSDLEWGYMKD